MKTQNKNGRAIQKRTLILTQFSILLAIEAIFCFTFLGSIPIGPFTTTLMMIPVIVTAITMGTGMGTLMGFFAGLFSFIVWTFMPPNPAMAFTFTPFYSLGEIKGNFFSLVVCFVPRILSGTVTGITLKTLTSLGNKKGKEKGNGRAILNLSISALMGSVVNTIGVLGGTGLFFGSDVSNLLGNAILVIIGSTILTSGIPEAIVSMIICPAISLPVIRINSR